MTGTGGPPGSTRQRDGWFSFLLPPGFIELPVAETSPAAGRGFPAPVQELFGKLGGEHAKAGVAHASVFVPADRSGLSASLAILPVPGPGGDAGEIARAIVAALPGQLGDDTEASVLRLACGPAAGAVSQRSLPQIAAAGDGQQPALALQRAGQFHAYVPVPARRTTLIFQLSVPLVPGWESGGYFLSGILQSLEIG